MRDPSSKMLQMPVEWEIQAPKCCRHHATANERSKLQWRSMLQTGAVQMPGKTTSARKREKNTKRNGKNIPKNAALFYLYFWDGLQNFTTQAIISPDAAAPSGPPMCALHREISASSRCQTRWGWCLCGSPWGRDSSCCLPTGHQNRYHWATWVATCTWPSVGARHLPGWCTNGLLVVG